jgi:hypothetical protein
MAIKASQPTPTAVAPLTDSQLKRIRGLAADMRGDAAKLPTLFPDQLTFALITNNRRDVQTLAHLQQSAGWRHVCSTDPRNTNAIQMHVLATQYCDAAIEILG